MNLFNLAAKLTVAALNPAEVAEIKIELTKLQTIDLQQQFFDYCLHWKLAPWVFTQLKNHDLLHYFDAEVVVLFQDAYNKILAQNHKRNQTAITFLEAFKTAGIDVIVLKGNYLAHSCYHEMGYKRMNDFDILIHKKDWSRIQDVYLQLGYIPLGFGWSGEKEEPQSYSHVGMPFISPDFSCIIGSQWGIKSPTTGFAVDIQEAWKTALDFDFLGVPVKALSPEYNVLHLVLHMGIYKCGLRDCMDVYNLVRTHNIDERLLLEILRKANATEKAYFTFVFCNLCYPTFSEAFLAELEVSKNSFLMSRLHRRLDVAAQTGDFQTSYNDYFQDIEKQVIYFNLFPKFHIKLAFYLKMQQLIFFPKTEMALRLNDCVHKPTLANKIVSKITAPYFVFALIAQEIGWKFTILLFIKLFVVLVVSLKNYVFPVASYFDYLRSRGVNPKDIENAVKNIQ